MTLELKLIDIDSNLTSKKPYYVYIQGGQSGSLRLTASKLPETIKCSSKDHLKFIICGANSDRQPQKNDVISVKDFWASAMLDQNREKWEVFSGKQKGSQYVLEYFNEKHQKQGEMKFQVKYNRGLFYQGQIQALDSIRLRTVPFYKGQCPTHNFYNCLDAREGPSSFNFIQHVYKDE